jgi:hypothetical protein
MPQIAIRSAAFYRSIFIDMYSTAAGIGSARQKLQALSYYQENPILLAADVELKKAYYLLEMRYQIWHSIYWKRSSSALKRQTNIKMYGLVFDAKTSLVNARKTLAEFERSPDYPTFSPKQQYCWDCAIVSLESAQRWLEEEFGSQVDRKQLKLAIDI